MSGEPCTEHGNICGKIGSMEAKLDDLKVSVDKVVSGIEAHIYEADKPGGVRDRVGLLEASVRIQQEAISTIKQSYWKVGLAYAVVGGLVARLAPDAIWSMIEAIIKDIR